VRQSAKYKISIFGAHVPQVGPGEVGALQVRPRRCACSRCAPLRLAPKALRQELHERLRALFEASDLPMARALVHQLVDAYADRAPKAIYTLEAGFDDATAVLALPEPYRRRLRTTNSVERLNEEIRRRERVIRIFPNRASAIRLLGALLLEQHEQWTTSHHYLDMASYWQWRQGQQIPENEAWHRERTTHPA
jgi:putative transposase